MRKTEEYVAMGTWRSLMLHEENVAKSKLMFEVPV